MSATPADPDALALLDRQDFLLERDDETGSWRRADPMAALIERVSAYGWKVLLPEGEDAHRVALAYDADKNQYVGRCDCDGYEYHEGPCAHLCTLRKADVLEGEIRDASGDSVRIERVIPEDERQARERSEKTRAAGRHEVAR